MDRIGSNRSGFRCVTRLRPGHIVLERERETAFSLDLEFAKSECRRV